MKPLERLPKVTKTHKITFYSRVIRSKDLVEWLESLPADTNITITQVEGKYPHEGPGYTTISAEEICCHEQ